MKEGIFLGRLEAMEIAISENTKVLAHQIAILTARSMALEEAIFQPGMLLFFRIILSVVAPARVAARLTKRENEILATMKEAAETRILEKSVAGMAKRNTTVIVEDSVAREMQKRRGASKKPLTGGGPPTHENDDGSHSHGPDVGVRP